MPGQAQSLPAGQASRDTGRGAGEEKQAREFVGAERGLDARAGKLQDMGWRAWAG
jgi:hypothetical protein